MAVSTSGWKRSTAAGSASSSVKVSGNVHPIPTQACLDHWILRPPPRLLDQDVAQVESLARFDGEFLADLGTCRFLNRRAVDKPIRGLGSGRSRCPPLASETIGRP